MRTSRFSQLVSASGKPEVATLWGNPKKDKSFMNAVKQNRVLTVHENLEGGKKDFGEVGFHPQRSAVYFVFPKKLRLDEGVKVVGINYDLLATSSGGKQWVPKIVKEPKPAPPKMITFHATVSRLLKQEFSYTITAANAKAAQEEALVSSQAEDVPEGMEVVSTKALRVDKT